MRFPAQLYLKIQLPRQTYFLLFMNKQQKLGLDPLRFTPVEMTCWGLSFANYYDVKYFFTIFYILFNFIYLSRLAIKRRYFPYTSSRA